ncbi:MAG: histidinol phosphatase [Micrococcales bacterium 73-13]|nr:MAG: histidinol phosphatase [Micrococcales bacterium 73-13]
MTWSIADDLSLALSIAADADLVSAPRFRATDLVVEAKPDRTPVTDADRAVERRIRERILAARPGDGILGEEFGAEGGGSRRWIVDPIDGTANFLRGVPVWGTLLALAVDGEPLVGVVSAPALGLRWWGARGCGAWVDRTDGPHGDAPRALRVSGVARLGDAYFSHGAVQLWEAEGRGGQLAAIAREVWRDHGYGDFWQHMLVAEGVIDAAAEFDVQPYDVAAIIPIVEEAGGRFTDAGGTSGPWGGSAVSTNALLHDELLDRLRG